MSQTSGGHQVRFTDGKAAEKDMLAALKNTKDVSLESEELMQKVKDIPSYYHLGVGRSAILRCLDLPAESRVLELGAGCGAITRNLGETFACVEAIEESPIRAEIARERCRDLENVSILCKDLRNESFAPNHDIVVIIGVLEHAPVYIYPEEAFPGCLFEAFEAGRKRIGLQWIPGSGNREQDRSGLLGWRS